MKMTMNIMVAVVALLSTSAFADCTAVDLKTQMPELKDLVIKSNVVFLAYNGAPLCAAEASGLADVTLLYSYDSKPTAIVSKNWPAEAKLGSFNTENPAQAPSILKYEAATNSVTNLITGKVIAIVSTGCTEAEALLAGFAVYNSY